MSYNIMFIRLHIVLFMFELLSKNILFLNNLNKKNTPIIVSYSTKLIRVFEYPKAMRN